MPGAPDAHVGDQHPHAPGAILAAGSLTYLEGDGPESGEDVAAVAHVEVAPRVADEARAGCPRPAAEDFLRSEVGQRVLLVRIAHEARVGLKGVLDPFPDVPDHLAAAGRAVPRGQRSHVDGPARAIVEVGALRSRRLVAPWEPPLAAAQDV